MERHAHGMVPAFEDGDVRNVGYSLALAAKAGLLGLEAYVRLTSREAFKRAYAYAS